MIRRNFLKTSGLLSLAPLVPTFVNRLATQTKAQTRSKDPCRDRNEWRQRRDQHDRSA